MNLQQVYKDYSKILEKRGLKTGFSKELREQAFARFEKTGLPTRRTEDWKYTPVEKWLEKPLMMPSWQAQSLDGVTFKSNFDYSIVIKNGMFREDLSFIPEEIQVRSLTNSEKDLSYHSEAFYSDLKTDSVFDLAEAFTLEGLVIEVAANTVIKHPIEIVHLAENNFYTPTRTVVNCGKCSQITLFERFLTSGQGYHFSNSITEIFAEASANVRYCQSQEQSIVSVHAGHINVMQNADSQVDVLTSSIGGGLTRFNANMRLLGEGARAALNSLYLVDGAQHTDLCSVIDHSVPNCESSQLAKGILSGTSRGVFNGVIKIRPKAQKSNSSQLNKTLVLDPRAEIDTRPQLQIDADDVKAAHGATVGQIDPEELFYLQSRAISREESSRILSQGFVDDVLYQFPCEKVREDLLAKTKKKLEGFKF